MLDVLREQSNVGERVFFSSLWEGLIGRDWRGDLEAVPGLATEWRRIDDQTVELKLRQGVKFHNGDEMTAEDVVFTLRRASACSATPKPRTARTIKAFEQIPTPRAGKELPLEVPGRRTAHLARPAARRRRRQVHGALPQRDAGRDARGAAVALRLRTSPAAAPGRRPRAISTGRASRSPPAPTGSSRFRPDVSLTLEAHDEYWGGRPPLKRIRFVEVPEVASRINGLLSGEYQFACDIPPDQIAANREELRRSRCRAAPSSIIA